MYSSSGRSSACKRYPVVGFLLGMTFACWGWIAHDPQNIPGAGHYLSHSSKVKWFDDDDFPVNSLSEGDRETQLDKRNPDCSQYNGNSKDCRANKCHYCCSDKKCYQDLKKEAPNCVMGCKNYCEGSIHCAAAGCKYDYDKKTCSGKVEPTGRRFSINICGEEHSSTHNGKTVWYSRGRYNYSRMTDEFQKVYTKRPDLPEGESLYFCYDNNGLKLSNRDDPTIYKTQITAASTVDALLAVHFEFPILEDGSYKLVLHFAELWKPVTRRMLALMGFIEVDTCKITLKTDKLGEAVDEEIFFTISDNLETIKFMGVENNISDPGEWGWLYNENVNYKMINLELFPTDNETDNHVPILNAFYVEKLKDEMSFAD